MSYKDYQKELQYKKDYYWKNKEKIQQRHKKYCQENKEKIKLYREIYYQKPDNKKRHNEYNKKRYWENREKINQKRRLEYNSKYHQNYYRKNKEKKIKQARIYQRKRRKTDIKFRLDRNLGTAIYLALKKKKAGRKWEILVGYTIEELIKRLEFNFDDKMSWDNYGKYWWIDHKKPRSLFKYKESEDQEFKDCWCLANLQPLEKIENIKKSNKY